MPCLPGYWKQGCEGIPSNFITLAFILIRKESFPYILRKQLISSFQFQYIKNKAESAMQQQFPQLPIWHISIHTSLAVEGKLLYFFAVLFLTISILRLLSLTITIHDFIFLKFKKNIDHLLQISVILLPCAPISKGSDVNERLIVVLFHTSSDKSKYFFSSNGSFDPGWTRHR